MGTDKALQNHKWHKKNTWHYITKKKRQHRNVLHLGQKLLYATTIVEHSVSIKTTHIHTSN